MKRPALKGSPKGPYFAYDFTSIGKTHGSIYRAPATTKRQPLSMDGDFVMQVATHDGADELVALLNAATALAARTGALGGDNRYRIAAAVAQAMGGKVDFETFVPSKAAA